MRNIKFSEERIVTVREPLFGTIWKLQIYFYYTGRNYYAN